MKLTKVRIVMEELCVVKMLYWDSYRIKLPLE